MTDNVLPEPPDVQRRRKNVAAANGTLALEGLQVTPEAREDQERYIRGELTIEEALERARIRHTKLV